MDLPGWDSNMLPQTQFIQDKEINLRAMLLPKYAHTRIHSIDKLTEEENTLIGKVDIFPIEAAGVKAFAMHNGGSDGTCHLEELRKTIQAHNPNAVWYHTFSFPLKGGKEGKTVRTTSQEFAAGIQNIPKLLVGGMDLWMNKWVEKLMNKQEDPVSE